MPTLVPPTKRLVAHEAASVRRREIERYFANIPGEGLFVRPFVESTQTAARDDVLEGSAAAASVARLRWQYLVDERLLLDRAVDVVERVLRDSSFHAGTVTVSLETLSDASKRPTLYPWQVMIRAPQELRLEAAFRESYDLGVGVEHLPPSRVTAFGRCQIGDGGLDGVVGGIFQHGFPTNESWNELLSLTCRHVVSHGCGSIKYPNVARSSDPDAVLLSSGPCFDAPVSDPMEVEATREDDIRRLQLTRSPLRKQYPKRKSRVGWLKYPVGATSHTGQFVRFPHYSVHAARYRIGFLRWPLFRRSFSHEGESGTWVLEDGGSRLWLGMIVGGYDEHHDTLVADGRALLDYFGCLVTNSLVPRSDAVLLAKTWNQSGVPS